MEEDMADSNGGGPNAGPLPAPPFPGEDFVSGNLYDLNDGNWTAVITIEPDPDDSTGPFPALKPLVHEIPANLSVETPTVMDNNAQTFPTGAATR